MAKDKKVVKKNIAGSDKLLKTVTVQLNNSLVSLKEQLGEKKFEKRIKKAAKKLTAGIKKTTPKKAAKKIIKTIPVSNKKANQATKK